MASLMDTKNSECIYLITPKDALCDWCMTSCNNKNSGLTSDQGRSEPQSQANTVINIPKSKDKECGDHNICLSGKLKKKSDHLGFWNDRFFIFKLCKKNGLLLLYWKNSKDAFPEERSGLYMPFPHRCGSSLEDIPPRGVFDMNKCIPTFNSNFRDWDVEFSIKNVYKINTNILQNECCRKAGNEDGHFGHDPTSIKMKANSGQTALCWYTSLFFARAISYKNEDGYQLSTPLLESKLSCGLFSSSISTTSTVTEKKNVAYDSCTYFAVYKVEIHSTTSNQIEINHRNEEKQTRTILAGWKDFSRRKNQMIVPKLLYDLTESTFAFDNNILVIYGANSIISTRGEKHVLTLACLCNNNETETCVCRCARKNSMCIISKWVEIIAPEIDIQKEIELNGGNNSITSAHPVSSVCNYENSALNKEEILETKKTSKDSDCMKVKSTGGCEVKRNIDFSSEVGKTSSSISMAYRDCFVDELILDGSQFDRLNGNDIMVDEISLEYSFSSSLSSNTGDGDYEAADDGEGFMDLTEWLDKQIQNDKENIHSGNINNATTDSGKSPKSPIRSRLLKEDILRREPWQSPRSVKLSPVPEVD